MRINFITLTPANDGGRPQQDAIIKVRSDEIVSMSKTPQEGDGTLVKTHRDTFWVNETPEQIEGLINTSRFQRQALP